MLCRCAVTAELDLCSACAAELPWLGPACRQCARALAHPEAGFLCGACRMHPPPFQRTIAALHYRRPVDFLIQDLKFHGRLPCAQLLGSLLALQVRARTDILPEMLVPVPLHPARQRQRGFNQALELARPVARVLGLRLAAHCCQRLRATETQSLLSRRARGANLHGAFAVTTRPAAHVAIVDDVFTTGSTARALAQALRGAGVDRVDVWCVARAETS